MLCEKLGLAVPQFGQMSLQRFGDLACDCRRTLRSRLLSFASRTSACSKL
jgi:hypothetical protein